MPQSECQWERVELGDGWYALKWKNERLWTLKKNGEEYGQGSLSECRMWVEVRNEWRKNGPKI